MYSLNLNRSIFHWFKQWLAFSLIHQWKGYFQLLNQLNLTDSWVEKYFSLLNQLILTEVISEIWLIRSNLFLTIWISKISLIISRFWLIKVQRVSKSTKIFGWNKQIFDWINQVSLTTQFFWVSEKILLNKIFSQIFFCMYDRIQ